MSRDEMLLRPRRGGDPPAGVHDVLLRRVTAEADPDGRTRFAIVQTERSEYVARPPRAASAGRTERESDIAQVREEACRIDSFASDVEVAEIAMRDAAIDRPARS